MNVIMKLKEKLTKKAITAICITGVVLIAVLIANSLIGDYVNDPFNAKQEYMYKSEADIYEYFSKETENTYELQDYDGDVKAFIEGFEEGYGDVSEFDSVVNTARSLSKKGQKCIDDANKMIIEYFKENYDLDVSAKLDGVKAMRSDFRAFGGVGAFPLEGEGGADGKTVFITKKLEVGSKMFLSTYIHEVIHYLGAVVVASEEGSKDSYIWTYFSDGVAEALTSMIMAANDEPESRPNRYVMSYFVPAHLVMQMCTANDELISLIFDRDSFITADEIEKYFNEDSSDITAEEIAEVITVAEENESYESYVMAQYYIGEYCKDMNPVKEEQLEIANCFVVEFSYFIDPAIQ